MKTNPALLISIGLVALTLGVLAVADMVGVIPDERETQLNYRLQLSEALAVQFSVLVKNDDFLMIQQVMDDMVKLNQQIVSAALRNIDGSITIASDNHSFYAAEESTSNFIKIPLLKNNEVWSIVEIHFAPLMHEHENSMFKSTLVRLSLFMAVIGFIVYMLLMRKVLRHMNPFNVVPARISAVMNAMSEGVCLIDGQDNIVLANIA